MDATRVQLEPAGFADVADVLDELERTLRQLSGACYALAPTVAQEELAEDDRMDALTKLHELGAHIGSAARRARAAREEIVSAHDDAGETVEDMLVAR